MLSHAAVGLDGRVPGVDHAVLAEDLAVWLIRVSVLANGRSGVVLIEDVESVDIARSELRSVDLSWEKSGSLIGSGDVGTADVGNSIAGLNARVDPALFLDHGHEILNSQVSAASLTSNLLKVEAFSA